MSLVRLCCEGYQVPEDKRELAAEIWPELKTTERWVTCQDKFVDINELPGWVGEVAGIYIKPLKTVKFVSPAPRFNSGNMAEVREFVNTVNQIVMPGFDLLRYGAIRVETDSCTEAIQSLMDQQWRIIAVMPQTGQRRPDYILVRESKP